MLNTIFSLFSQKSSTVKSGIFRHRTEVFFVVFFYFFFSVKIIESSAGLVLENNI